jgi:hypothetical protein
MNIFRGVKISFVFLICFLAFCTPLEKPKTENYHELIQHVIAQDEHYLQAFKEKHEKNWSGWKLMNSRIDAFESSIVIKETNGDKEETVRDTNCILEWNHKLFGKIRRETYTSKFVVQSTEVLYYRDDSIYAKGTLQFFPHSESKMLQLTFLRNKLLCKPCSNYSYKDYVSAGASSDAQYEEYQILDSLNNMECSYISPKFGAWRWEEKNGNIKVILSSDTTIKTNGSCPFVELKEK